MAENQINILDGTTFMVCDRSGDILASPDTAVGLFAHDTRLLSKWVLTINGERLSPLALDDIHYFEDRFFLVPGPQDVYVNSTLSVRRTHTLNTGLNEKLIILNNDRRPVEDGFGTTGGVFLLQSAAAQGAMGESPGRRCVESVTWDRSPRWRRRVHEDQLVRAGRQSVEEPREQRFAACRFSLSTRPQSGKHKPAANTQVIANPPDSGCPTTLA